MSGGRQPRRAGTRAEDLAEAFFVKQGYFPLARNHHTREGEVDLIVGRADVIVFAEVKLRRPRPMVEGLASVTLTKQRRIVRAAMNYAARHRLEDHALRFDILVITPAGRGEHRFEHIEGAFDTSVADEDPRA